MNRYLRAKRDQEIWKVYMDPTDYRTLPQKAKQFRISKSRLLQIVSKFVKEQRES